MTETTASASAAEQQKTTAALFGALLIPSPDPMLKAHADLLESVEMTMTGWLRRRHEAIVETQSLVSRLRNSSDPADFVTAQQEWVSGEFRRLAADAAACQSAAHDLVERARHWYPNGAQCMESAASAAAGAANAAGRPLRMTPKAAE